MMPRIWILVLFGAAIAASCTSTPDKKDDALQPPTTTVTVEAPAPPTDVVPETEKWRMIQPTPGDDPTIVLPKFESATLKNGLTIIVSERRTLPIVSIAIAIRAGSGAEKRSEAGLADLTYELLLEGAGKRDGLQLADAFADLGTSASVGTGPDGASISARVLTRNVGGALRLLADVVQRPRFTKKDFERKKKERLSDLAKMVGEPRYLSREATRAEIFGEDHPYGHLGTGTPASVAAIELRAAKKFYQAHVGPKSTALILTGDVSLDEAKRWARKYFGKWRGRGKATKAPAPPVVGERTRLVMVPKAKLGQTVITIGRPGLEAGHEDEWALRVATDIFGGLFSSRLNLNLREDKGYTYGARASVDSRHGVGALFAFSQVRADVTGPSLAEFFAEIEGLQSRPITQQELSMAIDGAVKSLPGKFERIEGLAAAATDLYNRRLPLDRYEQMLSAYRAMDADKVRAAAKKYYVPRLMKVILVGDPDLLTGKDGKEGPTIREQLEALGLGKVELREVVRAAEN